MEDPVKLNPCGHFLSKESAEMIVSDTNLCSREGCGQKIIDFAQDKAKANEIKKYNEK